jgi:hypothetical protein
MARRWLQIHLSTAVVLIFSVSGMLLRNATSQFHSTQYREYGWPFLICREQTGFVLDGYYVSPSRLSEDYVVTTSTQWVSINIGCNVAVAVVILFILSSACEFIIRRREARHEGSK